MAGKAWPGSALTGQGIRGRMKSEAKSLVDLAPDKMREKLAPAVDEYCESLLADMRDPQCVAHRTAMILIPQILRATGSGEAVVAALIAGLGGSVDRAREAVDLVGALPDDIHAIYLECKSMVDWYEGPLGPGGRSSGRVEVLGD